MRCDPKALHLVRIGQKQHTIHANMTVKHFSGCADVCYHVHLCLMAQVRQSNTFCPFCRQDGVVDGCGYEFHLFRYCLVQCLEKHSYITCYRIQDTVEMITARDR